MVPSLSFSSFFYVKRDAQIMPIVSRMVAELFDFYQFFQILTEGGCGGDGGDESSKRAGIRDEALMSGGQRRKKLILRKT